MLGRVETGGPLLKEGGERRDYTIEDPSSKINSFGWVGKRSLKWVLKGGGLRAGEQRVTKILTQGCAGTRLRY